MQLAVTLAIILTLTVAAERDYGILSAPNLRWLATLGCIVLPAYLARLWMRVLFDESGRSQRFDQLRNVAERIFLVTWILATAVVVGFLKWDQVVRYHFGLADAFLLDELLILLPVLLPWLAWWALEFDCDRLAVRSSPDGETNSIDEPFHRCCWRNMRQVFMLPLVPLLAIVAVEDLLLFLPEVGVGKPFFYSPILLGTPFAVPFMLRWLWDVRPIVDGPLAERIERILERAQTSLSGIYLWNSNGQLANAAVAGLSPGPRYLFLSDGLLARLTPDEVDAVVAHELSHLRHRHLMFILLSLALPFLVVVISLQCIERSAGQFPTIENPQFLIVPFVMAVWLFFHRVHARMLEHHADLEACRILSGSSPRIDARSVASLSQALSKVASPHRGRDWWHPAVECRIAILETFQRSDIYRASFDARVIATHRLIVGFTILLALASVGLALIA
jgi:Zn-dependent protease with chaperone function